jgi:hypothetical protein
MKSPFTGKIPQHFKMVPTFVIISDDYHTNVTATAVASFCKRCHWPVYHVIFADARGSCQTNESAEIYAFLRLVIS